MVVSMMQSLPVPILGVIRSDLGASTSAVSWVTTATLLAAAVFTPLLGRIGDQHGKKKTLVAVLVVMVIGSVITALAHNIGLLVFGRALQGIATAIFPLALSILREEVRPKRLPGAMALVSGTLGFGSGLALVAAGLLTSGSDPNYRNTFWLATGLAVLALVLVVTLVPATKQTVGGHVDFLGAATLGGALLLLLLAISQGHEWGWGSAATIGCFAGAVVMFAVWAFVETKVNEPLVDMRMFIHRPVLMSNIAGLLVGFGMFAAFLAISYFAQIPTAIGYGFGASVLRASVEFLLPCAAMSLVAAPFAGIALTRIGPRMVLLISSALGVIGFGLLVFEHDSSAVMIIAGMFVGAAVSFGYGAMPAVIAYNVPSHQSGIANGINSISRTTGSAIGSALVTTILASMLNHSLPKGYPAVPADDAFTVVFTIAAVCFLLLAPVATLGMTRHHEPAREVEKATHH